MLGASVFPEGGGLSSFMFQALAEGDVLAVWKTGSRGTKAYKDFQQTRHQEALQKPWNMKDVFKVFVNLGAYHG